MPSNQPTSGYANASSNGGYTIDSRGTNSQGNNYDTRTDSGGSAYHYSNSNGSYYYSNSNGSTYHNTGPANGGSSTYTAPNGYQVKK